MKDDPAIDPVAWLKLSDYELGFLMLAQFAKAQADKIGMPESEIDEAFIERVRQHVLTLQAESAKLAPVEVALHAVASGDPERAGRLYRQLLIDGATALIFERFTVKELQRRKLSSKTGGENSGKVRRAASRRGEILAAAAKLRKANRPRPDWRGIIAKRLNLTPQYVGRVLSEEQEKRT